MTRFLLALAVLLCAGAAEAAITEVGSGSQRGTNFCTVNGGCDSTSKAYPGNVTAGNALIVAGWCWRGGAAPADCGVSDSQGNTYTTTSSTTADTQPFGGNFRVFISCAIAGSSAANTVTVNPTGGATDWIGFSINEYSGVSSCTADATVALSTGTSSTPSTSITTATDNALVIGNFLRTNRASGTLTITEGSGLTTFGEAEACCGDGTNTQFQFNQEFKVAGTAGSVTVNWTTGSSVNWAIHAVSFAATVSGGGGGGAIFCIIGGASLTAMQESC